MNKYFSWGSRKSRNSCINGNAIKEEGGGEGRAIKGGKISDGEVPTAIKIVGGGSLNGTAIKKEILLERLRWKLRSSLDII